MQNMTCSQLSDFIVQLVEHCTSIAEGMGSNPLKPSEFFMSLKETIIIILAYIVQVSARMTSFSRLKLFLLETVQKEGWSTWVVHGPGAQW